MQSPQNPLVEHTMERGIAILTTIFVLNILFMSVSDLIKLEWIERETATCQKRKWDGAILSKRTESTIGLIGFSGGLNCLGENKQRNDTVELYTNMKALIENGITLC